MGVSPSYRSDGRGCPTFAPIWPACKGCAEVPEDFRGRWKSAPARVGVQHETRGGHGLRMPFTAREVCTQDALVGGSLERIARAGPSGLRHL
jgi:hypothetical protein